VLLAIAISSGAYAATITVEAGGDIAAANALAEPNDIIEIAAGTFVLAEQIAIKDGVTYKGAGAGQTIIDGNNVTRAFFAWGDRGATDGQVDANGVAIPNTTGPKGWVLDGLTIQNCVADTNDRFSYAAAALNMLEDFAENDTDGSGGLNIEEANADTGAIRLPGPDGVESTAEMPSADDDVHRFVAMDTDGNGELSVAELEAQLLSKEDEYGDKRDDGCVLVIENGAVGTIQNCEFLNNTTRLDVDEADGGALIINGSTITIANCTFDGNKSTDKGGAILVGVESMVTMNDCHFKNNQTSEGGEDNNNHGGAILIWGQSKMTVNACRFEGNTTNNGHGGAMHIAGLAEVTMNDCQFDGNNTAHNAGHIKMSGNSDSPTTPGTTLIANRCDFSGGKANNNGGVFHSSAMGSIVRLDACQFYNNSAGNVGGVMQIGNPGSGELTITNCLFYDNKTTSNRLLQVMRNTKIINCTFYGNEVAKNGMIRNHAQVVDTDGDDIDDEFTDLTQVVNCLFVNNVVKNQVLRSRNTDFTIAATNCLFFGNTLTNGNPANNMQNNRPETGSIEADPLLDDMLIPGPGSPAIDAGVDPAAFGVPLTTDFSGNPRPQGAAYDIGAYEVP
jgi:predicted outer membrane repeat protein